MTSLCAAHPQAGCRESVGCGPYGGGPDPELELTPCLPAPLTHTQALCASQPLLWSSSSGALLGTVTCEGGSTAGTGSNHRLYIKSYSQCTYINPSHGLMHMLTGASAWGIELQGARCLGDFFLLFYFSWSLACAEIFQDKL